MTKNIAVIRGDGIGPEIVNEAIKVLDAVAQKFGHTFCYTDLLMGGCSIDANGEPLTDETIEKCKASDAVLMGSIGGNTTTSPWYKLPAHLRPEAGLLKLRKSLGLFANLRPSVLYPELRGACPLREDISEKGFDMLIMRELTGGLYFGERKTEPVDGVMTAVDTLKYDENEHHYQFTTCSQGLLPLWSLPKRYMRMVKSKVAYKLIDLRGLTICRYSIL